MTEQGMDYTGCLTGNPFLYFETKTVAMLLLQEYNPKTVAERIGSSDLFQYRSLKSVNKRVNTICKRLEGIDRYILERLASGSAQEGKIISLLAIARSDRLFREFLGEVVSPKMHGVQNRLMEGDIRRFFDVKTEVSPKVATFSESTQKKLRAIYLNILFSIGILNNRKDVHVQKLILEDEFRKLLLRSFPPELIRMIEGRP